MPERATGELDERLRALAHPVRRQLLAACLSEQRRAGELVALTGQPDATISEHLKVLRKSGLVEMERDGRLRLYRTNRGVIDAVRQELADLGEPPQ